MTTTPTRPLPAWVLTPGSPSYDAAVAPWNLAVAPRPLGVVEARGADDVVAAVRLARDLGVTVTVQATGHGVTSAMTDSILVSTRAMTSLRLDPDRRTATVGAGVRWQQVLDAAAPHGLAALAGSAPHVGVVGYTTGGGLGPVAHTHGVASDRVAGLDVVTGDGELRHVTATDDADLFWALRGGRGLTGIVTAVELELLPIATLYAGAVFFDGNDAGAVVHRWAQWSADLPDQATTSLALLRLPPLPTVPPPLAGRLTVAVRFAWTGDPDSGAAALAPMRATADALLDSVGLLPYAALGSIHADPVDPMPIHDDHALLGTLPAAAVDALLALAGPEAECPQVIVELRRLGGAVAAEGPTPSAFDARHASYAVMTVGVGAPPVVEAVRTHAAQVLGALEPWQVPGGLPTFAARAGTAWLQRTYRPETLARLAEISRRHDPDAVVLGAADLRRPSFTRPTSA